MLKLKTCIVVAAALFLNACADGRVDCRSLVCIGNGGTHMVYDTAIDRIVYLGHEGGTNLLNVSADIDRPRPAHTYVFRGGAYTWLAPQSQWIDETGTPNIWPPDPQIDEPAMNVLRHTATRLELQGPATQREVREYKDWSIDAEGAVHLQVRLLPVSDVSAGSTSNRMSIWSTTTARRGTILAVPSGPTRFDSEKFAKTWKRAAVSTGAWQVLDVEAVHANGKAFIDGPPMLAAWRNGVWFVRQGDHSSMPLSDEDEQVEVCIVSPSDLIELELIGPYLPVSPDGGNRWSETWRVIPCPTPDISVLPVTTR